MNYYSWFPWCFIISSCSPHLVLIAELSEFIASSLPVSIIILPSRSVLKVLIPNLISVGFISFFNWSLICSGDFSVFGFQHYFVSFVSPAFQHFCEEFSVPPSRWR